MGLELETELSDLAAKITILRPSDEWLTQIVIVGITQTEYDTEFGGGAEPDPEKLTGALIQIAKEEPALIVVDIHTSKGIYAKEPLEELNREYPSWHTKFLWARPIDDDRKPWAVLGNDPPPPGACSGERRATPLPFCNGSGSDTDCKLWNESGLTWFVPDQRDNRIRTYRRQMRTLCGRLDTLPYEAANRYKSEMGWPVADQPSSDDERERLFSLWGGPINTPASSCDQHKPLDTFLACSMTDALANPATLRSKIVIVGGWYKVGGSNDNDSHRTASGVLPGFQIIADALETELRDGGPVLPSEGWSVIVTAIIGTILTFAFRFGSLTGLTTSFVFSIVLLVSLKWLGWGVGVLFPIPLVFCILLLVFRLHEFHEKNLGTVNSSLFERVRARWSRVNPPRSSSLR